MLYLPRWSRRRVGVVLRWGVPLGPWRGRCPAGLFLRRVPLPGVDATVSLPGCFAEDQRNPVVCRHRARGMGRPAELFGLCAQVRRARSLDRLELSPAL